MDTNQARSINLANFTKRRQSGAIELVKLRSGYKLVLAQYDHETGEISGYTDVGLTKESVEQTKANAIQQALDQVAQIEKQRDELTAACDNMLAWMAEIEAA